MRFIDELEGWVSSETGVIKTFLSMIKLEAKLAGMSVFPLLMNLCMVFVSLTCVGGSAMGLLTYLLMQAFHSLLLALVLVFLINCVLLGFLCSYLRFNLKKMSFEKTRAYVSRPRESERDESKTIGDSFNSGPGEKIMEPTGTSQ